MSKYIKLFDTHTDYNTYITGQDKILPNVSYCENEDEVHFNPLVIETKLVAKFNVTSTSNATAICYSSATSQFTEIEIDGVVQPSVVSSYTFDTTGEHTVKYTLADPTKIGDNAFYNCYYLSDIQFPSSVNTINTYAFYYCFYYETNITLTIPDSITTIKSKAFLGCSGRSSGNGIRNLILPSTIQTIGEDAFYNCNDLQHITINAITPPLLGSNAFRNNGIVGKTIYVPSESVSAYKAASGWSDYASVIQAIP